MFSAPFYPRTGQDNNARTSPGVEASDRRVSIMCCRLDYLPTDGTDVCAGATCVCSCYFCNRYGAGTFAEFRKSLETWQSSAKVPAPSLHLQRPTAISNMRNMRTKRSMNHSHSAWNDFMNITASTRGCSMVNFEELKSCLHRYFSTRQRWQTRRRSYGRQHAMDWTMGAMSKH